MKNCTRTLKWKDYINAPKMSNVEMEEYLYKGAMALWNDYKRSNPNGTYLDINIIGEHVFINNEYSENDAGYPIRVIRGIEDEK